MFKKLISLLLVVALAIVWVPTEIINVLAAEDVAELLIAEDSIQEPYLIQSVKQDLWTNTAQVVLTCENNCTLVVALYDSITRRMVGYGATEIIGEQTMQPIDVSTSCQRDENMTLKAFLLDSETWKPLCESLLEADNANPGVVFHSFYADIYDVLVGDTQTVTFYAMAEGNKVSSSEIMLCDEGGNELAILHDDGHDGDEIANDGLFSVQYECSSDVQKVVYYHASCQGVKSNSYGISYYLELSDEQLLAGDYVMEEIVAITQKYVVTGDESTDLTLAEESLTEVISYLEVQEENGTIKEHYLDGMGLFYVMPGNLTYVFSLEDLVSFGDDENNYSTQTEYVDQSTTSLFSEDNSYGICVIQPFNSQKPSYPSSHLDNAVTRIMNTELDYQNVDYYTDGDASIEAMKNLGQYHIILIESHGMENAFYTGEKTDGTSDENPGKYSEDRQATRIIGGNQPYYLVTDKFFSTYYQGANVFDESLVFLGCCDCGDSPELANAFLHAGARTVLAYQNSVNQDYADEMFEEVIKSLCEKEGSSYHSIKRAVKDAKNVLGENDQSSLDWLLRIVVQAMGCEPASLKLFGDMTFTLNDKRTYCYGDAKVLLDGSVELTPLDTWKSGSIWIPEKVYTGKGLTVQFQYWAGGGRDDYWGGADGIICCFSSARGLGDDGEYLGFVSGEESYGVELDSYSENPGDPDGKHIAVVYREASNHLAYVLTDQVDDSLWHTVKIVYQPGIMEVWLDGMKIMETVHVLLNEWVYLGFSAATGAGQNRQVIRNYTYGSGSGRND